MNLFAHDFEEYFAEIIIRDGKQKEFSSLLEKCFLSKSNDQFLVQFRKPFVLRFVEEAVKEWISKLDKHFKSDEAAVQARKKGNQFYALKNLKQAHHLYSRAIQCSTIPSQSSSSNELCFAFGNRSAVNFELYQYSAALDDIENAIKFGYPQEKLKKLESRKLKCLEMLKNIKLDQPGDEEERIEKKIESVNPKLTCGSSKIQLSWDSEKSRKIVASQDISFGELIMSEPAFAKILHPEYFNSHCHYCWVKLNGSGIPCLRCDEIFFCSKSCRESSDKEYHLQECGIIFNLSHSFPFGLLILRMLFKVGIDKAIQTWRSVKKSNEYGRKYQSNYESIVKLKFYQHENEEIMPNTMAAFFLRILLEKYDSTGSYWSDQKRLRVEQIILTHLYQIKVNLILIREEIKEAGSSLLTTLNSYPIGLGLFPTFAMFNHSCKPSIFSFNQFNQMKAYAADIIKAGQEIFYCYDASIFRHTFKDRKEILKSYHFECKCKYCLEEYTSPFVAYLCPKCQGPLFINFDKTNSCSKCKSSFEMNQAVKEVKKARAKFHEGNRLTKQNKFFEAVGLLSESYNTLLEYLHPYNLQLSLTRKCLTHCLALLNHYDKASKLSALTAKLHKEIFGMDSVEYGNSQLEFINYKVCELIEIENEDEANLIRNQLLTLIDEEIERFKKLGKQKLTSAVSSYNSEPFKIEIDVLEMQKKIILSKQ